MKKKVIATLFILILLFNLLIPNNVQASQIKPDSNNEEEGGTIFAPICSFITFLCDSVMQFLQNTFISLESIDRGDGTYNFQYSPAIIFSGTVPAFDINFIKPNTDVKTDSNSGEYIKNHIRAYYKQRDTKFKDQYEAAKNREGASFTQGGMTKQDDRFSYSVYYWAENDTIYIACMFDSGWHLIRREI